MRLLQITRRAAPLALFAAPAFAASPMAVQAQGISFAPAPTPHLGALPVRPNMAKAGTCGDGCIVVDFETIADQGVVGTLTGPVDVTFGSNWRGLVDSDDGGSGNFANEPTPNTVAFVSSGTPTPIDFSTGVNFIEIFYVAGSSSIPMTLTAWDGPGGTGNVVDTSIGDVVGNGGNCTGDPSGVFCLWDVVTLTSTGNNILSITLAGATSDQFAFDSMTFCTSGDADGDGLLDDWELCGLDINGDGTVDLDLPGMGADPSVPDIFVEIDAMSGFAPAAGSLAHVEAAFAASGVQLHILMDETSEPAASWAGGWTDFDGFKANRFGTAAERASGNATNALLARRQAVRYCVFGQDHSGGTSAGLAEIGGNDFFVTLGGAGWNPSGGTADQQCGMFMHLLGHSLGLDDGGNDAIGFKPNYPSIMNPTWTLPRTHNAGRWALQYSSGLLNALDETNLDETAGLGGALNQVSFAGPAPFRVIVASDFVDWDRNGVLETDATEDINNLDPLILSDFTESYTDYDDWAALVYNFRDSSDFADTVHLNVAAPEIAADVHAALDAQCPRSTTYCTGTTSSLGVEATIFASGVPTLSGTDDFEVVAQNVLGGTFGLLVTSLGEDRGMFIGGTLCVAQPFVRTALVASGGTPGLSDGELRGAVTQAFMGNQGWMPGTVVYSQWLFRDSGLPNGVATTGGLVSVVCP